MPDDIFEQQGRGTLARRGQVGHRGQLLVGIHRRGHSLQQSVGRHSLEPIAQCQPLELLRRPYVAFALVYTFAFIYAFSSLGNFGILARQRSQLLPVLFVVLCIPKRAASTELVAP